MQTLLNAVTAAATSAVFSPPLSSFQATGTVSDATGAATVIIEVSNDGVIWLTLGTITLALATAATSDGFVANAGWPNLRARIAAGGISGTDATVTVIAS